MNEISERYVHFVSCLEWLNEAWALLRELRSDPSAKFSGPAFRFALILYAKPYRQSHGTQKRRFKLDTRFVPAEHLALHARIVDQRDQLHAHTDIEILDPTLYVGEYEKSRHAVLSRNHIDPMSDMRDIEQIIALIEATLDAMTPEAARLEAALPLE